MAKLAFLAPLLLLPLLGMHCSHAALPTCTAAGSSGWGSSYSPTGSLSMPPGVTVEGGQSRPPGPLTVENQLMYLKVRSDPRPNWGNAGLQVVNVTSGTWLGTLWSPDADGTVHYGTPTVVLRSLESSYARNRHAAFFSARAVHPSTLLHCALMGTTVPATTGVMGPGAIGSINGEADGNAPVLGFAWTTSLGAEEGEVLSDPALFDSLEPGGTLRAGSLGFLALSGQRHIYVVNASSGALLYTHQVSGRLLGASPAVFQVPPVNFRGLAIFPTVNRTVLAFNLATRTVAWEVQLPSSFFASLQPTPERLVVRLAQGSLARIPPYFFIAPNGSATPYDPDPFGGISSPRVDNPRSPVTAAGAQYLLLSDAVNASVNAVTLARRIGVIDIATLEQRTVALTFNMRVPPLPAAVAYDSCRLVIYGLGFTDAGEAVTSVYVADVATGALIYSKELPPLELTEDVVTASPYVDAATGTLHLLRNNELYRIDPAPIKPLAPPPYPPLSRLPPPHPCPGTRCRPPPSAPKPRRRPRTQPPPLK